jgi:hypothetical protein
MRSILAPAFSQPGFEELSSLESSLVSLIYVRVPATLCVPLTVFSAGPEEFFQKLMCYFASQLPSLDHGVVIVEASIDSSGCGSPKVWPTVKSMT